MRKFLFCVGATLCQVVVLAQAKVISIPASGKWDGTDGPWSSFHIYLGSNPSQKLRLLPGFVTPALVPIDGQDCAGDVCDAHAELTYFRNQSFTWRSLDITPQGVPTVFNSTFWSYEADSVYGEDNLGIGETSAMYRNVANATLVAPMSNITGLSVGIFGLMEAKMARTIDKSTNQNKLALINQLQQDGLISVRTWSYTAGLRSRNVTGSLVLGGYDAKRVSENQMLRISDRNVSDANNMYLALQAVGEKRDNQYSGKFLDEPTTVKLVSEASQIWLPSRTCDNIAAAYGLEWNETYKYYLLSSSKRDELKRLNISLTFKIASDIGSSDSVLIELPYEALDLSISINGTNYRYFPIIPTIESKRFVLGRAFFQSTHITVNYEYHSINIGQARFPEPGESPLLLDTTGQSNVTTQSRQPLIGGLVGGIVCAIVLTLLCVLLRRRRAAVQPSGKSHAIETSVNSFPALLHDSQKPELPANPTAPPPAYRRRLWSNATTASEVDGIDTMLTSRLDCLREELNEAPDKVTPGGHATPPAELEGSSLSPAELDAGFDGLNSVDRLDLAHANLDHDGDETSTIRGEETESFASLSIGDHVHGLDEPVSPLVSRGGSRSDSNAREKAA